MYNGHIMNGQIQLSAGMWAGGTNTIQHCHWWHNFPYKYNICAIIDDAMKNLPCIYTIAPGKFVVCCSKSCSPKCKTDLKYKFRSL